MYGRGHQRWGVREKMPVEREEKVCARESTSRERVCSRDTEEDYYISMVHVGGN